MRALRLALCAFAGACVAFAGLLAAGVLSESARCALCLLCMALCVVYAVSALIIFKN